MRSEAGPRIGLLSPAVGTPFWAQGKESSKQSHHSASRAGACGLDPGGQWQDPVPRSTATSALTCVGHLSLAPASVTGTPRCFGVQCRTGTKLPNRPTRSCGPGDAGCQRQLLRMDSSETPGPLRDAACGEGARATSTPCLVPEEVSGTGCNLGSGPKTPCTTVDSQAAFTSSFSFIQLSMSSAEERGEAEGCPPSREAEDTGAKAASLDSPPEDHQLLSPLFNLKAAQGPGDSAQTAEGSPRPEWETLSTWDTDAAHSCFPDASWSEGDALPWDTLLRKCEPVLLDCLQTNRRQLEVNVLRVKLQKLQEKAVEDDDYDKAETIKQRLEDLERERSSLQFQLPSRQPALGGLLEHLRAQAEAALRRAPQQFVGTTSPNNSPNSDPCRRLCVIKRIQSEADGHIGETDVRLPSGRALPTHEAGGDDTQTPVLMEPKTMEPSAQDNLCVSVTRRDWLLQEKQQLQKEIEALQARMSVLEAKDQQLRKDIETRERVLPWQGWDLAPLTGTLSLDELREVSKALHDTLAFASRIPLHAGPPEALRSLQERMKPLNSSLKEITAKVCVTKRLCSTLRKKVNELETQLPPLLEAKMAAISGNHFCMAKELTEEIRSLTSEREGLEGLLNKLVALSSRNIKKLRSVNEDYGRLRRELDQGRAAYETDVKENTSKYTEVLEEKLRSCKCPLLGKVWEADLEACHLLIQSLQLQEAWASWSAEDRRQMDDLGGAACTASPVISPRSHSEDERKTPLQAFEEWKAPLDPSPHCTGSEQESYMLSAELGEKCDAIGKKLLYLEDQLHTAIRSHDDDLFQSLRRELQMVKETLQAMILQLQPAKEAGEGEAVASSVIAAAREAET